MNSWKSKEVKSCVVCQKTLGFNQEKYCSYECSGKAYQKVDRPSKEQLAKLIEESNFVQIGKKYGVSDNTVRKWARKYGLL